MDTSLGLLLERLLWPVPRVRWETARALAKLIRAEVDGVLCGLTDWTAKRTLESECLLGLGVIHAFDLADFCPEVTARKAVSKPSLASDWMLKKLYDTREGSAPFRYTISPRPPARLEDDAAAIFDRFNAMAVPPAYLHTLEWLESALDFPFVARWRHDWSWICRSNGVRVPEAGFFLGSGRGRSGSLHMPQGEMLVSAYLRTLAYALHIGRLRENQAEYHAMLALPINRGLADVEPVERPAWSQGLLRRWRDSGRKLVGELWTQTERHAPPGEMPAALYLVEADEKDFVEINVDVVVAHRTFDFDAGKPASEAPKCGWADAEVGCMAGDVQLSEDSLGLPMRPMTLACLVPPEHVGRVDAAVALQVKLACLGLGRRRAQVHCRTSDIELRTDDEVVSRWRHWYSDWEPSKFTQLDSNVCGMTTVQRSSLRKYAKVSDYSMALLARVHVGTREHAHQDHSANVHEFWIDPRDSEVLALANSQSGNA